MDSPTELEFKGSYSCKRCKISFSTKRESLLHKKSKHDSQPEYKKYICNICNKRFANHGNMYRHMRGHEDLRPHKCQICRKSFAQAANLSRHYSVHNGERPFTCKICQKSFTQQGNLKRHELIHTGEKPFRCKRCGRMFSQRINLKKHVMLHQGFRPFRCTICKKAFLQSQNYAKHLQKHQHQDLEGFESKLLCECAVCGVVFENFLEFQGHEIFCEVGNEEQVETTYFNADEQLPSQ